MKKIILVIVLFASINGSYGQGFLYENVEIVDQLDTLYMNGQAYPCVIQNVGEFEIKYYTEYGSELRSVKKHLVERLADNREARRFVNIDPKRLVGSTIYMSVVPVERKGRYHALVDTGTNQGIDILRYENEKLAFNSELATVNWFISQGWELYKILDTMEAESGFSQTAGLFLGVDFKDWTIRKTYIMRKLVKDNLN